MGVATEQQALPDQEVAADPVPEPEPQTEIVPAGDYTEDDAAADGAEAAADADQELPPPSVTPTVDVSALQQQVEALQQRIDEQNRRDRQAERAKEAREKAEKRAAREEQALADALLGTLGKLGYHDVPVESVKGLMDRHGESRAQFMQSELSDDYDVAIGYHMGRVPADTLTERQIAIVRSLGDHLGTWATGAREQIVAEARKGWVEESTIPKLIEADNAARQAKTREKETNLRRVDGTPQSNQSELEWWRNLDPQGRRDPANIARFDKYTASQR